MKNDCLFCGIIHGEMPAYTVYEDDTFLAMLDRFPKCAGHILILPKIHAATLFDLPDKTAAQLFPLAKKLATKLHDAIPFQGLNVLQNNGEAAGQTVRHFHLHLIPRFDADDMVLQWKTIDPSPEDFEKMAELLR